MEKNCVIYLFLIPSWQNPNRSGRKRQYQRTAVPCIERSVLPSCQGIAFWRSCTGLPRSIRYLKFSDLHDSFHLIENDYVKMDVFVECDDTARILWQRFVENKSKPLPERRNDFLKIKRQFLDHVISVPKKMQRDCSVMILVSDISHTMNWISGITRKLVYPKWWKGPWLYDPSHLHLVPRSTRPSTDQPTSFGILRNEIQTNTPSSIITTQTNSSIVTRSCSTRWSAIYNRDRHQRGCWNPQTDLWWIPGNSSRGETHIRLSSAVFRWKMKNSESRTRSIRMNSRHRGSRWTKRITGNSIASKELQSGMSSYGRSSSGISFRCQNP